jgi:hypothetical protein
MGNKRQNNKNTQEQVDWKQKSIARGKEAKMLNKRIRELIISRDSWKSKYTESKKQSVIWEIELTKIKKKLNEILNQ